jgi:simple sugar transport system substrate-binding protein
MGLVACSSPAPAAAPTTAAAAAPAAAATTAPAAAAPTAAAAAKPAAAATTAPATTGKQRFLVWATHVFYNQPALLGIPVGFHDFLDPLGWKFQVVAARTSTDVQETIAAQKQALQLKPDVVVGTMTDSTSFNASLKAIVDAGIYLELNNTQPDEGNPFGAPYIGQSFFDAGIKAMTVVLDGAVAAGKKEGPVLFGYCCGNKGAVGTRTTGLKEGMSRYNTAKGTNFTASELLDASESNPASATGVWQAKLRQQADQLVGIVSDHVGNAEIEGLIAMGKKPGFIPIITFDVTAERLDYTEQGWFTAIVDQQPYAQGFIPASQAFMWLEGHTQPASLYDTGSALITKDGVANVRAQSEYITRRAGELGLQV